jgi:hypothetical protein
VLSRLASGIHRKSDSDGVEDNRPTLGSGVITENRVMNKTYWGFSSRRIVPRRCLTTALCLIPC